MSQAEKFVPIVPISIEQVQQVQNNTIGTNAGTAIGTSSLKALAIKQLREQKQVQPQVQAQVQAFSPCTCPEEATGTDFRPCVSPALSCLPSWVRSAVPGEVLNDAAERLCSSPRCMAVFKRQPGQSDESWWHKRYCTGQCFSGRPSIPCDAAKVLQ